MRPKGALRFARCRCAPLELVPAVEEATPLVFILLTVAVVELGWLGLGATLAAAAYRSDEANVWQSEEAGTRGV